MTATRSKSYWGDVNRLPWNELDDVQQRTVKLGPNVKKLVIHWVSRLIVPDGGGIHDVIGHLTDPVIFMEKMREALNNAMTAIDAVRAAPDNTLGDDDELIAAEILRQIEERKRQW